MSTIEIKGINKSFGKNMALSDVSLTLRENCICGLLGRNGAGKTTLMNIISGRMFADSGEVLVDGINNYGSDKALGKIHMTGEQLLYSPSLRVRDMFATAAMFYPDYDMKYAMELCGEYKLDPKKKLGRLSTGYRSIAKLINALACGAPVILFDEPVLGLDANHRDMFYRQVLNRYNERPAAYVISTHLIEEAANMIERAIVIKEGKILLDEDTDVIRGMGYCVSGKASEVERFISGKEVMSAESIGGLKNAYIKGSAEKENIPEGLEVSPLSLQELFIHLTNS